MLTPSAVETLRAGAVAARRINGGAFMPEYPNTLVNYPIPLKSGCPTLPEPQIALNWITGFMTGGVMLFNSAVPPAPDDDVAPDVRAKLLNTIAFAAHCDGVPHRAPMPWDAL